MRLSSLNELEELPDSIESFTNLRILNISGCFVITQLPSGFCQLGALEKLYLCSLPRLETLPTAFGKLTSLKTLDLNFLEAFTRLPDSFGELPALLELDLCNLATAAAEPMKLPFSFGSLTSLQKLTIYECWIEELPSSFGQLSGLQRFDFQLGEAEIGLMALLDNLGLIGLRKLILYGFQELTELPASVGLMTNLQLTVDECGITMLPSSIWSLTQLQKISISDCCETFQVTTLAQALPHSRLLQCLQLPGLSADNMLAIWRSFQAWPTPLLERCAIGDLKRCSQALLLPESAAEWDDKTILSYFRLQQEKVATFASGLHARLGAASCVARLNDLTLMVIAHEVLGRDKGAI